MIITWVFVKLVWVILFLPLAPYAYLFLVRRQSMKDFKIGRLEAVLDAYVPESETVLYVYKGSALYLVLLAVACAILALAYETVVLRHFLDGRAFKSGDIKFVVYSLVLFAALGVCYLNAVLTVLVITDQRVCVRSLRTRFTTRVIPLSQVERLSPAEFLGRSGTRIHLKDGTHIRLLKPSNPKDFLAAKEALGL